MIDDSGMRPSASETTMTQSLGNMVACEALRQGLHVSKYFMFDAAVATEAIDATLQDNSDDIRARYVKSSWYDYTNACWAANWYRFFEDDPTDSRGKMKWPGRFTDALANATEVFNYYSTGDAVFTETEDIPSLPDGTLHIGIDWSALTIPFYAFDVPMVFVYPTIEFTLDNHCWQKQEVMKGMKTLAGTASGGWRFNIWREYDYDEKRWNYLCYTPYGASVVASDGSVTNRPVFDVSGAEEMMNHDAPEEDVFLALAKHVPALSSPVGGNAVRVDVVRENIDMNDSSDDGVPRPNGWGRDENHAYKLNWLHSDMKDVAFFYVYKLYEQLVDKGGLK